MTHLPMLWLTSIICFFLINSTYMKLYASLPRWRSCPGTDRSSSVHDSLEPSWTFLLELQIVIGIGTEQEESVLNCLRVYQRSSRMTHTIWPWNGLFSSCRHFQMVKVLNDDSGWFTFRRAVPAHLGLCEAPPGLCPNLTVNMTLIQWLWMLSPQRKPFLRWLPTAAPT